MNRADFQALALERTDDAKALLQLGRYAAAYYMAGYAIECALKAVVARQTKQDDFPPKNASNYYVHDLEKLIKLAALGDALDQEIKRNKPFRDNWQIVKDWNEESRYQSRGQTASEDLLAAITDVNDGVLQWLKHYW